MKKLSLLLTALAFTNTLFAQRTIPLSNIWTRPQVHVVFQSYLLSFTIKDIDRALELLNETGDTTFGTTCELDTSRNYFVELYPGFRQQYHNKLQILMQRGVGAFLLSVGHAYIENPKHKQLLSITTDMDPRLSGLSETTVKFYDPKTKTLIFDGKMAGAMYNKDLGID